MAVPAAGSIETVREMLRESAAVKVALAESLGEDILMFARWVGEAYARGGKVLLFGNGGSMCDANHIAGELVGRYKRDRRAMPALALSEISLGTAISNDLGYEAIFARQIEAWAQPGDIAVALSTSGKSPNVLAGLRRAKETGARTVALTGADGLADPDAADLVLAVPSRNTPRIQEAHITIGHIVCELVEGAFEA